jgi:putative nucleotidyltransferase with HDIG domain
MTSDLVRRALTESALRPLPKPAGDLLEALDAPPRLIAHLRAVHDVAWRLADWVGQHYPVEFDRSAVLFGAAVHDIGKTVHVGELSGPGSDHEHAGYEILLAHGVDPRLARFARNHASWHEDSIDLEDLLVSLADKVWKGKRVPELERLVTDYLAVASGQEPWQVFMALNDELDRIAEDADRRLAFQASYPVTA